MRRLAKARGFTYLAVLFAVAMLGTALAAIGVTWSTMQRREKEQDLLFVGNEYRRAIASYYERTPGTIKRYPQNMNDLLKDNRHVSTLRHLRRRYNDPITNQAEWGIVRAADGGIMGLYSLSAEVPFKRTGFLLQDGAFEKVNSYAKWQFIYEPQTDSKLNVENQPMHTQAFSSR